MQSGIGAAQRPSAGLWCLWAKMLVRTAAGTRIARMTEKEEKKRAKE
jgi:hypothetical protein